jgi:hypothetical protein
MVEALSSSQCVARNGPVAFAGRDNLADGTVMIDLWMLGLCDAPLRHSQTAIQTFPPVWPSIVASCM